MGDRREQMTIVGPDFRLARLESGRGVNGVAGSQNAYFKSLGLPSLFEDC